MKRLLKRTSETSKVTTASKTSKEVPEPETYTEKGSTNVAVKSEPMLGKCRKCDNHAHSEVDHLCYDCRMEAAGREYDAETNRYTKRRK